ncbi:MAG: hypothetical protein NWR45_09250 [Candidatus Nanopelagicales bacterium]|jgi:quercetin dioxygenase-like cupin family protein|nr:hypothetical protein [Candidatus Nanopelagicales bacterium]
MSEIKKAVAAVPSVEVDDGHIRVTRWHFEPGASTGMHVHEFDYLVVPVTGGEFIVNNAEGLSTSMIQQPGECYKRQAGVMHNVISNSPRAMNFVEIEFLV